jgi:hypothetical protein
MKLIPIVVNNMTSRKTSSICIDMIEKSYTMLEFATWIVSHNIISSLRLNIITALTPIFVVEHDFSCLVGIHFPPRHIYYTLSR